MIKSQFVFRSRNHEIYTEKINKIVLSSDNNKRIQYHNGINTYPYGYFDNNNNINNNKVDTKSELDIIREEAKALRNNSKILRKEANIIHNTSKIIRKEINKIMLLKKIILKVTQIQLKKSRILLKKIIQLKKNLILKVNQIYLEKMLKHLEITQKY